ncbi:MFS polyamine transporter [Agrocybe pediades]|nr:MFS polyamine transporter [Agrocybe pediades]
MPPSQNNGISRVAASKGATESAGTSGQPGQEDGIEESSRKHEAKRKDYDDEDILWVDWDGPNDPANPRNWKASKKWAATIVVASFNFISTVTSSMIAPASEQVTAEFHITSSPIMAMTTSAFIFGYSIGPLFLSPMSETYGRSRVLQLSNLFYFAWNLACGFVHNESQLIAFRFLSGVGGSAPLSLGGGVIGDVWHPEERGTALAIYSLAPLLGPVVGPVCGAWIGERSNWRWVFYATSIANVVVQILGLFFLRETFPPVLLERKANKMKKTLDAEQNGSRTRDIRSVYDISDDRSWQGIISKALVRPFAIFFGEPIVQILGIYMTFTYGIFYLFLTTMPTIFTTLYHEPRGISGLNYIALGIGLCLASQINATVMDRIYVRLKDKNGGVGEPEFRLPSMFPGTFILPVGLLLTGWAAEKNLHWVAVDIGIACVGAGMILCFQSIQTYVIDTFTLHAASALAAVNCIRSVAGFGFPLFAPAMYASLGYGKGDTILAVVAIGLGCPAPFLLWKYGKRIRMSSKYAEHSFTRKKGKAQAEEGSNVRRDTTE